MEMITARRASYFLAVVPEKTAELRIVAEDGEVRHAFKLAPGEYTGAKWLPYLNNGDTLNLSGGAFWRKPYEGRAQIVRHNLQDEVGANADWRPARQTSEAREMRLLMEKIAKKTQRLERMQRALQRPAQQAAPAAPAPSPETGGV